MSQPLPGDGFTSTLLQKLESIRWSRLDAPTRQAAHRHFIDTVGVIYAGSREATTEIAEATVAAVRTPGNLPVPGRARGADVLDSAYIMSVAGHCLEFDDGFRAGAAHPGVVTVPAALAVGNFVRASGEALLEALVAGYEAMTSIARIAHPMLRGRGFHPTAAVGVFAAAAAAGRLLELDASQQRAAFGLAASSAGGLAAFSQGGADVKRLHIGHAAREGVFAALLARQGAVGPPLAIEGPKGFFASFVDQSSVAGDAIGESWGIRDCYIKPWPCCGNLLSSIDAVLQLRAENCFSGEDVDSVEVETYRSAADRATTPWDSFSSAQLSFPFILSTALIFGDVKLEHFSDDARSNSNIEAMASRFRIRASAEMDQRYRSERPSRVKIILKDGRRLERDMPDARGSPEMPMTQEDLASKFITLTSLVTDRANASLLYEAWSKVSEADDISHLSALPL